MRIEEAWEAIVSIILAVLGGMARLLNKSDERAFRISYALGELFIAAFVGGMVYLVAKYMNTENNYLMWLFAGSAGWIGPKVLDKITDVLSKVNVNTKDNIDSDK
jgi:hypothetical protein